jgi:hypothetical protein
LVVTSWQTDAFAPISPRESEEKARRSYQSLIGLKAAAPTISTATRTHTPTMARPRRFSFLDCWERMESMTA